MKGTGDEGRVQGRKERVNGELRGEMKGTGEEGKVPWMNEECSRGRKASVEE